MNTFTALIASVLLLAAVIVILQKSSPTYALLLSLATAVFLLWKAGQAIQPVLQGIALLGSRTNGQAFSCLIRCAGVLLLTDYTRTVCEEAGAGSLGWCVGFIGRCFMLLTVWPLMESITQTIWGLTG